MDGNTLIEVIKTELPVISSSVSAIVGAIITTLFLRKNTSTTEFEKVKAGKFSLVIDQLLESGKMSYLEYYRCRNFLSIAKKADEKNLDREDNNQQKDYDFDWFIRFYDYASNISNQEMQELWAKILAGEVAHPTSTPLTLLHTLSMMQQEQAKMFYNLSRFALMDANNTFAHLLVFIASNRAAYERENITTSNLKELERLGLIECNFIEEYVFAKKKMFKTGNRLITVYGDPDNNRRIKAGNAIFTKEGQMLYTALDDDAKKYRSDILDFIVEKFRKRNCRVLINDREVL